MFDKDKDGFLSTDDLRKIMKERMSKKDLNTMIKEADSDNDGFINCQGRLFKQLITEASHSIISRVLFHPVCRGDKQSEGKEEEKCGQC